MPAVTFDGAVVERTNPSRYLEIHFDRMLTYKKPQTHTHTHTHTHKKVETTALKCKKGLSVLKAAAAKGIEQRHHHFLLH